MSMEGHTFLLPKNLWVVHISQRMALYLRPLSHMNLYHCPPIMHCLLDVQNCLPFKFHCSSVGEESTCNAVDLGLIPGLGNSPGEGKVSPLQYSGLENYTVHGVAKSWTRLSDFHFHTLTFQFHTFLLLCTDLVIHTWDVLTSLFSLACSCSLFSSQATLIILASMYPGFCTQNY